MGKLRAAKGHPAPYKVWWGIGNEMWGDFQYGHRVLSSVRQAEPVLRGHAQSGPLLTLAADGNTPRMGDTLTDNHWVTTDERGWPPAFLRQRNAGESILKALSPLHLPALVTH